MDWPTAMHVGLGLMRLSPAAFWAMTPREFAAACRPYAAAFPDRPGMAALMELFPDKAGGTAHG
jgi:uncharacterized phage protein (TIGR02216 family)